MSDKKKVWNLYSTAKATAQRPSNLVDITDRWTALQFDNAVTLVGTVVENAAQEQTKVGKGENAQWVPKYHMDQLLDPVFRLPRPPTKEDRERQSIAMLKAIAGRPGSGVKVFKGKSKSNAE